MQVEEPKMSVSIGIEIRIELDASGWRIWRPPKKEKGPAFGRTFVQESSLQSLLDSSFRA